MDAHFSLLLFVALSSLVAGQTHAEGDGWVYDCVGNCNNAATVSPLGGLILMGGSTDVGDAFRQHVEWCNGGDFLIIRASGSDAYNNYVQRMGPTNSVATFVMTSRQASFDEFVLDKLKQADAIFMAGGDQNNYVTQWIGTPVQDTVLDLMTSNNIPIGGTSAGLAVLGEFIYSAANGTVTSTEALQDPFNRRMAIDNRFIFSRFLDHVITDSHFYDRDRMGRLIAFVARLLEDGRTVPARGIGVDERTAVAIDENGIGTVYGSQHVYFLTSNVRSERCAPNQSLIFRNIATQRLTTGQRFDFNSWVGQGIAYEINVANGEYPDGSPY